MQFTLADAYNLNAGEVFAELMKVSREVRMAAFRDPEWRALALQRPRAGPTGMKPRWDTFEVSESERFPELLGRRVTDIAAERGSSPLDVMCELSLAEDLKTRFRAYIANDDPEAVGRSHRGSRGARPHRCRRPRRPAVRRAAPDRPARQLGPRARGSCRSSRPSAS